MSVAIPSGDIELKGRPGFLSRLTSKDWQRLLARCRTQTELAERLGCTRSSLMRKLEKFGLSTGNPAGFQVDGGKLGDISTQDWKDLWRCMHSRKRIAEVLDCTPAAVSYQLEQHGIVSPVRMGPRKRQ